ncbi:transglycosylase family protein [Streptomyces sp. NPDC005236]|uniref:transglycosylase family protein n=1 Tax=Streptomyces sp. NPDC005236 TaxID=3157028 RepID=UPI0033BB85AE
MTGSAIVIPLLAATSASAADGTTWDRVAQCESGGAWSADQGNGYYGGLQLDQDNWETYGGLEYAQTADQASRSQQIAVAEKVLADQGLKAWPTCGPLSGLSKGSGEVSVDTGLAADSSNGEGDLGSYISSGLATSPSSSPSTGSSASGDSSGAVDSTPTPSASQSSDGSGATTGKSDESAKPGQKEASSSASETPDSGGRHRGGKAAETATGGGADSSAGRHAASVESDTVDDSYAAKVLGSLWDSSDSPGAQDDWGNLSAVDPGAADSGPGLVVPGRSIAVVAETA